MSQFLEKLQDKCEFAVINHTTKK